MNKSQIVLLVGAVVIVVMMIFPPWVDRGARGGDRSTGYHFAGQVSQHEINTPQLLLQVAGVAIAAWFISVALKDKTLPSKSS